MRKTFSIFIALYFIAIIGLVQITTERNALAAKGKTLYNSNCKSCHGNRGKGASCCVNKSIRGESFKDFKKEVESGNKQGMRAFTSLKKKAVKSIWKYVKK